MNVPRSASLFFALLLAGCFALMQAGLVCSTPPDGKNRPKFIYGFALDYSVQIVYLNKDLAVMKTFRNDWTVRDGDTTEISNLSLEKARFMRKPELASDSGDAVTNTLVPRIRSLYFDDETGRLYGRSWGSGGRPPEKDKSYFTIDLATHEAGYFATYEKLKLAFPSTPPSSDFKSPDMIFDLMRGWSEVRKP